MSDDIFNQISNIIAKKGISGVSKDAAEWSAFLSEVPKSMPQTAVQTPNSQNYDTQNPADRHSLPGYEPSKTEPSVQENMYRHDTTATVEQTTFKTLDDLHKSIAMCSQCQLAKTRTNLVFGEGNPNAELMFIGEAPGADEDLSGRPFVGKAGQLLDKMITAMQFSRSEVYIANILKCRPPFNRNPEPQEAACCMPYLEEQIRLVNPKCIVLLGAVATKFLLNHAGPVSKIRGTWQNYKNIPVMITYHPSFLLRTESAKRDSWNDLQKVMAKFGKYHKKG